MEQSKLVRTVESALDELYRCDRELIGQKVNERAIAHRFALYLEPHFQGLNVDCEYNRYGLGLGPKTLPGTKNCIKGKTRGWIIPDILIHTRRSGDKHNLAIFEIKSGSKITNCDRIKLAGMTLKSGRFKYEYGFGIAFRIDHSDISLFVDGINTRNSTYSY